MTATVSPGGNLGVHGMEADKSDLPLFSLVVPWQNNKLVHLGSSADDGHTQWRLAGGRTRHLTLNLYETPGLVVHMGIGGTHRNSRAETMFKVITGKSLVMFGPVVFHGLTIRQVQTYMASMFEEVGHGG